MKASRNVASSLVVALLATGCGAPSADPQAELQTVPMDTWVAGLCTALGRFVDDLGLTTGDVDEPSQALADSRVEEYVDALVRLQRDVEALGIPDLNGGAALASDVVAGLRRSVAVIEQAGGPAELIAGLIGAGPGSSEYSAIGYPFGLLIYLGAAAEPVEAAIYLDDPVREAIIARLSRVLEHRDDVASIRFETKAQACRNFKDLFASQANLVENVDCDMLPASFRVQLAPGASGPSLHDELVREHGVDDVVVQPTQADLVAKMTIFTQGDLFELAPVRAEASRQPECMSLPPLAVLLPT